MNSSSLISIRWIFLICIIGICWGSCGSSSKRLKKYYPLKMGDKGWDTIYQTVPPLTMENQQAVMFNSQQKDSLLRIIHFFQAECDKDCDSGFQAMKSIQESFSDDSDVLLLSFTLAPRIDSLKSIQALAEKYGAVTEKWQLLRGEENFVELLSQRVFHHMVEEDSSYNSGISFSPIIYLVDRESRIRGKYDTRDNDRVEQLKKDIPILKQEYIPKTDWLSQLLN